jgi:hypothetical protein
MKNRIRLILNSVMPYNLCDCLCCSPGFDFHTVILAFLLGILTSRVTDFVNELEDSKILYILSIALTVLWIGLVMNDSVTNLPYNYKTEL